MYQVPLIPKARWDVLDLCSSHLGEDGTGLNLSTYPEPPINVTKPNSDVEMQPTLHRKHQWFKFLIS